MPVSSWSACAVAGAGLLVSVPAGAGIIATDDFAYPDGTLFGQNGGTGWLSNWSGSGMDTVSGHAETNVFGNPPKYGFRVFDNPQTNGDLFVKFRVNTGGLTLNDYFGCQLSVGVNNNIMLFGKDVGSTTFGVGNSGLQSTGITVQSNTEYTLIGAYHVVPGPDADQIMLWVNPDGADYFNSVTGESSADHTTYELVAFHAFNFNIFSNIAGVQFDDVVISNDAAGVGLMAPAPASALVFCGLAAVGGRRRRGQ